MREIHLPITSRMTSDLVPDLRLTHGRAIWTLTAMFQHRCHIADGPQPVVSTARAWLARLQAELSHLRATPFRVMRIHQF